MSIHPSWDDIERAVLSGEFRPVCPALSHPIELCLHQYAWTNDMLISIETHDDRYLAA